MLIEQVERVNWNSQAQGAEAKEKQVEEEKYEAKLELPGEADKVYLW